MIQKNLWSVSTNLIIMPIRFKSPDYIRTAMLDAAKKQDDKAKAPLSTRNENVTKEHQPNENAFLAPQFSPMSVDEDDASVDQENKQGQY